MERATGSVFRRCALASGLLTAEDLSAAEAALAEVPAGALEAARAVSTDQLARYLIDTGRLNAWQVEQLRHGRSKFSLGPYLVVDSIGQGGMGQVFKAEHTIMGRLVAIKVLPRQRSTPDAIASFHREIRAQAQLDHHNLVRALDAGHDGNVYYLVTEYVPGTDLRRLVRTRGRLPTAAAASIVSQAALGLEHAHSRGMIHRDIKPGNLLVTPDGLVKVSDLGLVSYYDPRSAAEAAAPDHHAGKIVGTADYLSPEQITSPQQVTPASDIYSLGCTLYYAVTGKVPFPGGTTREKARAHCTMQPIDPRRLNPELTAEFVDLLATLMAKDPRERPSGAAEVVRRLAPFTAEGLSLTAAIVAGEAPQQAAVPPPAAPWPAWGPSGPSGPPFALRPSTDPDRTDSPSQVSQVTPAMLAGDEETVPNELGAVEPLRSAGAGPAGWLSDLPPALRAAVLAALALALVLLGWIVGRVIESGTVTPPASESPSQTGGGAPPEEPR